MPIPTSYACISETSGKKWPLSYSVWVFPQSALIIFRPIQHFSFSLSADVSFFSTVASISTPVLFSSADYRFKGRDISGLIYLWIICDHPTPLHSALPLRVQASSSGFQVYKDFHRERRVRGSLILRLLDCFPKLMIFSSPGVCQLGHLVCPLGCIVRYWPGM